MVPLETFAKLSRETTRLDERGVQQLLGIKAALFFADFSNDRPAPGAVGSIDPYNI